MLFGHELLGGDGDIADLDGLSAHAVHFLDFGVRDLGQGGNLVDDLFHFQAAAFLRLKFGAGEAIPLQQQKIELFIEVALPLEKGIVLDLVPQLGVAHLQPQTLAGLQQQGFVDQAVQGHFLEPHGLDQLLGQLALALLLILLHYLVKLLLVSGEQDGLAVDRGDFLEGGRLHAADAPKDKNQDDGPNGQGDKPGARIFSH